MKSLGAKNGKDSSCYIAEIAELFCQFRKSREFSQSFNLSLKYWFYIFYISVRCSDLPISYGEDTYVYLVAFINDKTVSEKMN